MIEPAANTSGLLDAQEIQLRMGAIRAQLGDEVQGIVGNARQMVDWRHYVQAFPWGSLAVAASLGYFAVPRRLEIIRPDKETLEQLAKDNHLVVKHETKGEERPGVVVSLANLAGNMLLRAGIAYVGQQAGKLFGEQAAQVPPEHARTT